MGKPIKIDIDSTRLRSILKETGLRQQDIAARLNVNYQAFNRRLNQGKLSPLELESLCSVLNCDPEYIKGTASVNLGFEPWTNAQYESTPPEYKAVQEERKEYFKRFYETTKKIAEYYETEEKATITRTPSGQILITCHDATLTRVLTDVVQNGGLPDLLSEVAPLLEKYGKK